MLLLKVTAYPRAWRYTSLIRCIIEMMRVCARTHTHKHKTWAKTCRHMHNFPDNEDKGARSGHKDLRRHNDAETISFNIHLFDTVWAPASSFLVFQLHFIPTEYWCSHYSQCTRTCCEKVHRVSGGESVCVCVLETDRLDSPLEQTV